MKKLSLCVAVLLIISIFAIPAMAAQSASVSVYASSGTVYRGDTITVAVSTSAIENCTSGGFMFSYDSNVFEYVGGSSLSGLAGFTSGVSTAAGNVAGYFMNGNATVQGEIFQITLKVKDTAPFGSYIISGVPSMIASDGAVSCGAGGTTVTVTCNHSYGDWAKVDDTNHGQTCTVCQNVQKEAHNWNSGTITKQPTCKETGIKSFTCTTCSATKTEDIAKTTDHKYGNWTKANATTHKHTCSVCGKEETANHGWDNGKVTKQPTCKDTGVKTYTCTSCSATKTEDIAKTTDHKYGNWTKANDTTHKHTCSVCGKEETANHAWDNGKVTKQPTCKEVGVKTYTCPSCTATKTEDIAKTTDHKYGGWTKVNATTHKHTCSVCGKEETANHGWDNGKVTKQPTCKEVGVKTYTCTSCSATKTEDIAKTTDHKYGNWTKANATTHKHTCSVCGKEETANHTWNSGAITKNATCKEEGVKTYTCTACNATKTEAVAMLTTHTYDHDCDADCNVCGVTRTTTHQYKTTWSADGNNHWHECAVCKDKKDVKAHTSGAAATEYTAQTCTECGYVIMAALGHTHTYLTTWTTDEEGHWYKCAGCEEKGSYAEHDFENACDPDCSICEYTREVKHDFENEWTTDEINHWHECSGCGIKQDEAAHEPGAEATATTAQTCTICEYEIAPALGEEEPEPEVEEPETTAPTTTEPTEPADNEEAFPLWIVAASVVGVAAVAAAVTVIIKKKR